MRYWAMATLATLLASAPTAWGAQPEKEKKKPREHSAGANDSRKAAEPYVILLTGDESSPEKVLKRYTEISASWPEVAAFNLLRPGTAIELSRDMLGSDRPLAKLSEVFGETEVRRPFDSRFIPACNNLLVREGDLLRTWRRSGTRIVFEDGSYLLLRGNSRAQLVSLGSQASKTRLLLTEGSILSHIKHRNGHRFEVETPTAATIIRGTDFRLKVADDRTRLEVLDGEVELQAGGRSLAVPAQRGTLALRGAGPGAIEPLLDAPASLQEPQDKQVIRATAFDHRFAWSVVAGAASYRLEISRDENFFDLVEEVTTAEASARVSGLDEGTYFWRVSAFGDTGFEGSASSSTYFVFIKVRP